MDVILSAYDQEFAELDKRSRRLVNMLRDEQLFVKPRETTKSMAMFSCGEYILRSAAMIEKAFGGITTRLWDDPFEWTLQEHLTTRPRILAYLDDVEATRRRGFGSIGTDAALGREIPAPQTLRSLAAILAETLSTAAHFQGRAYAVFQMISRDKLPRL